MLNYPSKFRLSVFYIFSNFVVRYNSNIMSSFFVGPFEPQHDKTNEMSVRSAKTQISLGIRVFAVRMKKDWVLSYTLSASEDSDQTGRMPRLIWVFAGRTLILLILSCRGSFDLKAVIYVFFFSILNPYGIVYIASILNC